jgi:hypothetical protein
MRRKRQSTPFEEVVKQRVTEKAENAMAYLFRDLEVALSKLGITINMLCIKVPRRRRDGQTLDEDVGRYGFNGEYMNVFTALRERCKEAGTEVLSERMMEWFLQAKAQEVEELLDTYAERERKQARES